MTIFESTNTKLARLLELRNKAGNLAFERVKLAVDIFNDKQWVASTCGDDIDAAAKILQETYLADLCGAINFFRLVEIMREFPTQKAWEENKYNLTAMSAIIDIRRKQDKPKITRTTVTIKMYEELRDQLLALQAQLQREQTARQKLDAKVIQLQGQLDAAIRQKAQVQGQLADARQTIERMTGGDKKAS